MIRKRVIFAFALAVTLLVPGISMSALGFMYLTGYMDGSNSCATAGLAQ